MIDDSLLMWLENCGSGADTVLGELNSANRCWLVYSKVWFADNRALVIISLNATRCFYLVS